MVFSQVIGEERKNLASFYFKLLNQLKVKDLKKTKKINITRKVNIYKTMTEVYFLFCLFQPLKCLRLKLILFRKAKKVKKVR